MALAAACCLPAAAQARTACSGEDRPVQSSADVPAARAALMCLVDEERRSWGLQALVHDGRLQLAAQRHSDDMVSRNYFAHTAPAPAPYGADAGARSRSAGYDPQLVRENLLGGLATPLEVAREWMKSKPHCEQMLDPDVLDGGVGITPGAFADTLGPAWTLLLGTETSAIPVDQSAAPAAGCPYADVGLAPPRAAPQPQPQPTPQPQPQPEPRQPATVVSAGSDAPAPPPEPQLPQLQLRGLDVRWVDGILLIRGRLTPALAKHRIVVRVLRDGRRYRVAIKTRSSGHFSTYLTLNPERRGGTVKVTAGGIPGQMRSVTLSRAMPRR